MKRFLYLLLLLIPALIFLPSFISTNLRAASILARAYGERDAWLAHYNSHPVEITDASFDGPSGRVRARLYRPTDLANPPAMVVIHGLHHLGIENPRLTNFAQAVSASGITVFTPELPGIADYQVAPSDIALIRASAEELGRMQGGKKVGIAGLSFSGGLALMAANEAGPGSPIAYVLAVGAHDDLYRVGQYLVFDTAPRPDGSTFSLRAHEYGGLILIYEHLEDFFPEQDIPQVREVLRLLLYEDVEAAKAKAAGFTGMTKTRLDRIFAHDRDFFRGLLDANLRKHKIALLAVSPHGHLANVRVPVFLLHGAGDNVIPPSESEWLARELPPLTVHELLISPAISHVDMNTQPGWRDHLALVRFLAQVLEEANHSSR